MAGKCSGKAARVMQEAAVVLGSERAKGFPAPAPAPGGVGSVSVCWWRREATRVLVRNKADTPARDWRSLGRGQANDYHGRTRTRAQLRFLSPDYQQSRSVWRMAARVRSAVIRASAGPRTACWDWA